MAVCKGCGKDLVSPEDWGDYDDACEWGCTGCSADEHFFNMQPKLFFVSVGVYATDPSDAVVRAVHVNKNISWVGAVEEDKQEAKP
jgi:hypothetical protein